MTGFETVMVQVVEELTNGSPDWAEVRRAHRTLIPRASGVVVHVIDGPDEKVSAARGCGRRRGSFTVSIFVRDDDGPSTADPYKSEVLTRIGGADWPAGVVMDQGPIRPDTEIADEDVTRVDLEFPFSYPTNGEWSLDLPS
jgi:hypothetical protein